MKNTHNVPRRRNNEPNRVRSNRDTSKQPRYALTVQNVEENSTKENRQREKDEHFFLLYFRINALLIIICISHLYYKHWPMRRRKKEVARLKHASLSLFHFRCAPNRSGRVYVCHSIIWKWANERARARSPAICISLKRYLILLECVYGDWYK